jgi:hypothetical protein
VSRGALYLDLAIAGLVAFLTVILSPGLAVVGLLAVAVLIVCGISFAIDAIVRVRRRPHTGVDYRQSPPPSRRRTPRDLSDRRS